MKKFIVEYRENPAKIPILELKDFIFYQQMEAETEQDAALKAAEYTGRENIVFRVTEILPDGSRATGTHLIDLDFRNAEPAKPWKRQG